MRVLYSCVAVLALSLPATAQEKPTAPAAAQEKPKPRPAPSTVTATVQVTDRQGEPLNDVHVTLTGPVERSGTSAGKGTVVFRTLRAGTYRLRFERDDVITLEREIVLRAGQPADVSVALSAAPAAADAPPPPVPAEAPPPDPPAVDRAVDPRLLSLPDVIVKNLIRSEPQRTLPLACAQGGTARLLQIRDPFEGQVHSEVDEILYVVAGAGAIRIRNQDTKVSPGHFALVPRGVAHSLRREGRNPLILLSIFAGAPGTDGDSGVR